MVLIVTLGLLSVVQCALTGVSPVAVLEKLE
jgi:hypothetical protein